MVVTYIGSYTHRYLHTQVVPYIGNSIQTKVVTAKNFYCFTLISCSSLADGGTKCDKTSTSTTALTASATTASVSAGKRSTWQTRGSAAAQAAAAATQKRFISKEATGLVHYEVEDVAQLVVRLLLK